jgi:regulator of protease activity HflC (stomatin/prohibitin superfamily)
VAGVATDRWRALGHIARHQLRLDQLAQHQQSHRRLADFDLNGMRNYCAYRNRSEKVVDTLTCSSEAHKPSGRAVLKKWSMLAAVCVITINMAGCMGCTYIPPGYVGIKVNLYGTQRGVQDIPVLTGRVIYNPWTEKIYDFPTFLQYRSWVQNPSEGRPIDESITFVSLDKIPVNVDVSVAYQFEAAKVPELFIKFRSDPDTIADTYVRSRVRDAFVRSGSELRAMDILGGGIGKLDSDVVNVVDDEMAPIGIRFDYVSVLNRPRIPEAIQDAINRAIESTQRAQQAQNQIAVVKAEAEQKVAAATGEANATRARAQGEADALLLKATAEAKANQLLAASVTPELVRWQQIKQWKGDVPTYMGGQLPIPFMDFGSMPQSSTASK